MGSYDDWAATATKPLLGLAHALASNPHDAWDLTQETLVRVAERWRRLDRDPLADPGAWARTVMVRLNIDRIRRLKRELLPGRLPGRLPDRETHTGFSEGVDPWLLEALAELTPRQRTALALRHVEDLDVAGIAARMGCSVGTAKSPLSRGTERLKQHAARTGVTGAGQETR